MKKFFVAAGILSTLALMAGAAGAEVIATRVRTSDSIVPVGVCPGVGCPFLPLNNAGITATTIVTTVDNQRIERTTTSPLLIPTRICSGGPPLRRT